MNTFQTLIKKEFLHILRDPWTMIIILILPVLMLILFGYGISMDMRQSSFALLQGENEFLESELISKMDASPYFSYYGKYDSKSELESAFKSGEVKLALVFSPSFEQELKKGNPGQIQIWADATDPNSASTLVNYSSAIIQSLLMEYAAQMGMQINNPIHIEPRFLFNPELKGTYNTVPGIMGMILLLISAMMTSVSIAREKENGSMELLLASPLRPLELILSKVIPYFILTNINLFTILILGHWMLEVPIEGSLSWILIFSEIYLFLCLSIGLFISSFTSSQLVALLISGMGMILPVVLLSGLLFPIENMPIALQYLSKLVPAKWYIEAMRKLMIMGVGFKEVLSEFSILIIMCLFLVTASVRGFNQRID